MGAVLNCERFLFSIDFNIEMSNFVEFIRFVGFFAAVWLRSYGGGTLAVGKSSVWTSDWSLGSRISIELVRTTPGIFSGF